MRRFCFLLSLVAAGSAMFLGATKTCAGAPAPEEQAPASDATTRAKIIDDLFARLEQAPDAASAAPIRGLIERVWAHSASPTALLLLTRADSALKAGQPAAAAALLDRIVSLYPDWSLAWRRRAQSALAEGDIEGAMLDLNRALNAEPRDFLAMSELAELLRAKHEDRAALGLMRRALALDPRNDSLREETERLQRRVEGRDI